MTFRVEVEDLKEHGLAIIDVANPSFGEMLALWRRSEPTPSSFRADPSTVLLKNASEQAVVACRIAWQFTEAGGATRFSEAEFDALEALKAEGTEGRALTESRLGVIKAHSLRPFSAEGYSEVDSINGEGAGVAGQSNGPVGAVDQDSLRQFGEIWHERGWVTPEESDMLLKNLTAASGPPTLTKVSLDGALFADGLFVGPDATGYFDRLRARFDRMQAELRASRPPSGRWPALRKA